MTTRISYSPRDTFVDEGELVVAVVIQFVLGHVTKMANITANDSRAVKDGGSTSSGME